jgi:LacI family transcriptional regulator
VGQFVGHGDHRTTATPRQPPHPRVDDTQLARVAAPPLTTVRQPLREMGSVALRTALRLAAAERIESHHVELATELIVRGSTAPPPPR